jgi:hypothetical protein
MQNEDALITDLTLTFTTNEALDVAITLQTSDDDDVVGAFDFTNAQFRCQIRDMASNTLLLEPTVTITAPEIRLYSSATNTRNLKPGVYAYDIAYRLSGGQPRVLWRAPVIVTPGITDTASW